MFIFFPLAATTHNTINRFCSIAFPILLAYVVILQHISPKISRQLSMRDIYEKQDIKLRPYGIMKTILVSCIFLFSITFFACKNELGVSLMAFVGMIGYTWIRLDGVYAIKLNYTRKYIYYTNWKKTHTIPMQEISKVTWEAARHSAGYILVIYCRCGRKIYLPSADFVGLKKLKLYIDAYSKDRQQCS